tara:strand:- start:30806 stop:31687 length:882 start_codon:yes stop_codon:yes gene_type:complete
MGVENVDSEQQEENGGLDGTLSLENHMKEGLEDDQDYHDDQGGDDEQAEEQPQLTPAQTKASSNGWTDKDTWIESGKDPDDWVSANRFNEKGDMLDQIKSLRDNVTSSKQDFEQRLDNQQKLANIQLEAQRKELTSQRRDAIENADVDRADEIQGEIDALNTAPVQAKPAAATTSQQSEDNWNTNNPWILEETPKAAYAKQQYSVALGRGESSEDAIKSMESKVAEHFPANNPRRESAPAQESNRSKPGNKAPARKLQWSDITGEERKLYDNMPDAWSNKDEFLTAVADSRKS